jgi:hypothetical protein
VRAKIKSPPDGKPDAGHVPRVGRGDDGGAGQDRQGDPKGPDPPALSQPDQVRQRFVIEIHNVRESSISIERIERGIKTLRSKTAADERQKLA